MKFLIMIMVMMLSSTAWAAEDSKIQAERAKSGFELFKNICFMMSPKESWEQRTAFLDGHFKRHEAEKKKIFLDLMKAESGDVWAAFFHDAAFAVVVEGNGNCHVIAQKSDDSVIHEEMKKLSEEARKNLTGVEIVTAPAMENGAQKTSVFEMKGAKDGSVFTAVVVTTLANAPENKPAALMTVAVAPRPEKK